MERYINSATNVLYAHPEFILVGAVAVGLVAIGLVWDLTLNEGKITRSVFSIANSGIRQERIRKTAPLDYSNRPKEF